MNTSVSDITLFDKAINFYEWTLTLADNRTKGWLYVDSPMPTLTWTGIYLLGVWIGPIIMANHKPFKLKWALIAYNLAMTILNFHISSELFIASSNLNYNYRCEPCRMVYSPDEFRIAKAIWWFYFSKLLEFTDSLFFVLRKKDKQLTFLHIYHHSTMFPIWWIGIKWVPTGSSFLPAMINSFVHVFMYSYYALAALGPAVTKYLWWKKYLTMMQLVQFSVALIMGGMALISGCDFPLWMHYVLIFYMLSFLALFGNFYVKAYIAEERRKSMLKKLSVNKKQHTILLDNNNNAGAVDGNIVDLNDKILQKLSSSLENTEVNNKKEI